MRCFSKKLVLAALAGGLGLPGCGGLDNGGNPPGQDTNRTEVLDQRVRPPYVVSFDLRLRDEQNQAVVEQITRDSFEIRENGRLVDYTETNQFVTPGPSLPLRVVLVLDYTNSMNSRDAIGPMTEAARQFILAVDGEGSPVFTATHRMGLVEFHDRDDFGKGFRVVAPLTTVDDDGRVSLLASVPPEGSLEPGLTRVWDAVAIGIDLLESQPRRAGEVYTLVFLTDGEDTTSALDPITVRDAAKQKKVALYVVDFSADGRNQEILASMARQTGGRYFPETGRDTLAQVFQEIVTDLRGQWNLTYITQKNGGMVDVEVSFKMEEKVVSTFDFSFNANDIRGDQHQGVLEIGAGLFDEAEGQTRFPIRALYIPRGISRLRLVLPAHLTTTLILQEAGGLLEGWTIDSPAAGVFDLAGQGSLEFGAFGNIGELRVPGRLEVEQLNLRHDDTIYAGLPQAKTMLIVSEQNGPEPTG